MVEYDWLNSFKSVSTVAVNDVKQQYRHMYEMRCMRWLKNDSVFTDLTDPHL